MLIYLFVFSPNSSGALAAGKQGRRWCTTGAAAGRFRVREDEWRRCCEVYAQLVLDAEMSVAFRAPVGSRCQEFGSGFDVQSATVAAFENLLKQ
ncbi:hypothetical protein GE21DRAFT_1058000 [Neurospora crassa]|nr:hypothetical protein GE21DRAFT_1058000 [Neurospora crassa]